MRVCSTHTLPVELVSQVAMNSWIPLCRKNDVSKNTVYNVEFLDKSVDVVRIQDSYEVFDDTCPHRGAKLSHGVFHSSSACVECPYHGMKFDAQEGACMEFIGDYDPTKVKAKLKKYRAKYFDNLVWGFVGEGEPPEFTADTLHYEDEGEEFTSLFGQRDIECNMFEVQENLLDNIHISVVHSWGNPESLPVSSTKSERGNFFFYRQGKNSLANWLTLAPITGVTVFNGFAEPLSTLARVCFGTGLTKSVRVHLLPLGENRTRMFWGLHRSFLKAWWLDFVFEYLMEKTIDEDKTILENLANPNKSKPQTLTEFDWVIVQYRKKTRSIQDLSK